MAILRWFYKKRQVIFICLCASTFWLIYLFLSLPNNNNKGEGLKAVSLGKISDGIKELSPSRTYFSTPIDTGQGHLEVKKESPKHVVLEEPKVEGKNDQVKTENKDTGPKEVKDPDKEKEKGDLNLESLKKDAGQNNKDTGQEKPKIEQDNAKKVTAEVTEETKVKVDAPKEAGNFDKVIQMGEQLNIMGQKFKNKTMEVGAQMKNKTMEKLSALGVIQIKNYVDSIHVPGKWKLSLSLEDIGNIMKDTQFLNKQQNIDINYPKLLHHKRNYTEGNTTIALRNVTMANAVGFCKCIDYDCTCCARVTDKLMHFNALTCANLTYISKSQEFDFRFLLDQVPLYQNTISAEKPPKVCLSSVSKVAALCTRFLNVTSQVKLESTHKLHVIGCLEFSMTLYNKTVSAFPVDCFEIPSFEHHRKEHEKLHDFGNWMP